MTVGTVAAIVTVGGTNTSSLWIVTVALAAAPTVYAALAPSVATTVSSVSTAVSLIGVTVTGRRQEPAGITTLPERAA